MALAASAEILTFAPFLAIASSDSWLKPSIPIMTSAGIITSEVAKGYPKRFLLSGVMA
jgi:hypothetical protein